MCHQFYVTETGLAPEISYFNLEDASKLGVFFLLTLKILFHTRNDFAFSSDKRYCIKIPYQKPDLDIHANDRFSILRPETVESYFYLWRITKNQKYRDWGWTFFEQLEKYAKVEDGYTSIGNVLSADRPQPRDKMESFFLGTGVFTF